MVKSGKKWREQLARREKRNNRFHKIDEKGRVAIPATLRRNLTFSERLVLTKGFEKCIYAFSEKEWKALMQRIQDIPLVDEKKRNATRYIMGEAEEVEIDLQGRILLPGHLMEYAGITEECYFVRMPRWFEIWNPEEYQKTVDRKNIDFEELPI